MVCQFSMDIIKYGNNNEPLDKRAAIPVNAQEAFSISSISSSMGLSEPPSFPAMVEHSLA